MILMGESLGQSLIQVRLLRMILQRTGAKVTVNGAGDTWRSKGVTDVP